MSEMFIFKWNITLNVNILFYRCTGEQHLKFQGIDYSTWGLWQNHIALIVMAVIFLCIAYIKLRFIRKFSWAFWFKHSIYESVNPNEHAIFLQKSYISIYLYSSTHNFTIFFIVHHLMQHHCYTLHMDLISKLKEKVAGRTCTGTTHPLGIHIIGVA